MQIGVISGNLNQCEVVGATIDRYWPRIQTNHCFETHQAGFFVIGDAAGIARGYIQSMWSAHCAAHAILKRMHGIQHKTVMAKEGIEAFSRNGKLITIAA